MFSKARPTDWTKEFSLFSADIPFSQENVSQLRYYSWAAINIESSCVHQSQSCRLLVIYTYIFRPSCFQKLAATLIPSLPVITWCIYSSVVWHFWFISIRKRVALLASQRLAIGNRQSEKKKSTDIDVRTDIVRDKMPFSYVADHVPLRVYKKKTALFSSFPTELFSKG